MIDVDDVVCQVVRAIGLTNLMSSLEKYIISLCSWLFHLVSHVLVNKHTWKIHHMFLFLIVRIIPSDQ